MERYIDYIIDKQHENYTIEKFLIEKRYTRQSIIFLKKLPESILVNGKWEYVKTPLKLNDRLTIHIKEDDISEKIPPVDLGVDIVYEDEDLLVVNKMANMPIHPSLNNYENTLGNALAFYYMQKNEPFVFRCINRLDADTSGLTIVAKHKVSAGILYDDMVKRNIKRTYIAIVQGMDIDDTGTIDAPIGRKEGSTIEREINYENGEHAVTNYRVVDRYNNMSMIKLNLETGRTHQIRVHMKHIGHPLVGDWLYNPEDKTMNRQALHSYKLEFIHPITEERMEFVQEMPPDMKNIWHN